MKMNGEDKNHLLQEIPTLPEQMKFTEELGCFMIGFGTGSFITGLIFLAYFIMKGLTHGS